MKFSLHLMLSVYDNMSICDVCKEICIILIIYDRNWFFILTDKTTEFDLNRNCMIFMVQQDWYY